MNEFELNIAFDVLGLTDAQKQTVTAAIPTAIAMLDHINANKQLFATLFADGQIVAPAAEIILSALNTKGLTFSSLVQQTKQMKGT